MAGEAEISFEEAMGITSAQPSSSPAPTQPASGEISFADVAPAPAGPSYFARAMERRRQNIAFEEQQQLKREGARRELLSSADLESSPSDGFFKHAGKTALRGLRSLVVSPSKTAKGSIKALASGAISMGEASIAGTRGLFKGTAEAAFGDQPFLEAAVDEIEVSMKQTSKMRDMVSKITKINLAPEGEEEKSMEELLMLMPEGITAAGDTVYEQTGSALAGAGTQGLLTLLTFKPNIASKVVKPAIESVKSKQLFKTTFDELALSEPSSAAAIIDHVKQSDPKTAASLEKMFDDAQSMSASQAFQLGEQAAKAEINKLTELPPDTIPAGKPRIRLKARPREITPEEAGIGAAEAIAELPQKLPEKPSKSAVELVVDEDTGQFEIKSSAGEFLAQENGKYLQVKRADVVEAERGKGHAQEAMRKLAEEAEKRGLVLGSDFSVSPAAQRVYEALSKKGFVVKENPSQVNPVTGNRVSTNPRIPVYEVSRATEAAQSIPAVPKPEQIFLEGVTLSELPGGKFVEAKMAGWWSELVRTLSPEALGPKAEKAGAILANKIAEAANKDTANIGFSLARTAFWDRVPADKVRQFIKDFEQGKPQPTPELQAADAYIRKRNNDIYAQDQRNGIKYDPTDNYLYHIFEDGAKVTAYFDAKYGSKWGNPGFTKNRSFDLYEEAIAAGFKPKFTNPEEIMLLRQHASDIAQMQVEALRDLEAYGLAREKTKAQPDPPKGGEYIYRRSPNGKGYWIESNAFAVLHNAFDTKSLWTMPGIRGDIFKGVMFLKNSTIPVVLSLSLFHPLHLLLGMDSAAAMTRFTKEMVVSGGNPVKWFGKWLEQMTLGSKGIPLWGIIDNPRVGFRLLKAIEGKIDPAKLTAADVTALQYINEGGFTPVMPTQYRSNAMLNFRRAARQVAAEYNSGGVKSIAKLETKEGAASPTAKTAFYLPFAIIDAMQYPMFHKWIPALKIASYLRDVQTALKTNPALAVNKGERLLAFRKLAKSVDNRYGEMAYNTLFWNRMIKDIAVANTLSLGWNLGFIREYGGGAMDIVRSPGKKGSFKERIARGDLDRPLFVSFYTTQVMLYGGLITWALTGQPPTDLIDYLYPKSGETDAQGKPERLNTPFYPREFAAIAKHVEHEGLAPGLWHTISNKSSGVIGLVKQWATGTNWMGQEIRDPNSPYHQKVRDTVAASLEDLQPISIQQILESEGTAKDWTLGLSGFGKAPKYATQSKVEADISTLYRKYYTPKQTPYETALLSNDRRKLAKLYEQDKFEEYGALLDEMMAKYNLTAAEQGRLARNIMKRGTDYNPYLTMFERLTWQQQKRLLDEMSPEEREMYLPRSNRQHLRYTYEEPTGRDEAVEAAKKRRSN